jgi:hypothetical protein
MKPYSLDAFESTPVAEDAIYNGASDLNYSSNKTPSQFAGLEFTLAFSPFQKSILDQRAIKAQRTAVDVVADTMAKNGIKVDQMPAVLESKLQEAQSVANESKAEADKEKAKFDDADNIGKNIENSRKKINQNNRALLALKARVVSDQAYFDEMNKLTSMIRQAPSAPKPQQFELNETDNALVVLAGLLGGVEAMPQALQGVVAGAKARVDEYNQMAQVQYQNEQQDYSRQLSAQQNVVQTMGQRLQAEERRADAEYNAEVNKIKSMNLQTQDEIDDERKNIDRFSKSYREKFSQKTSAFTAEDIKEMEAVRESVIRNNLVTSQAELDSKFPIWRVGEMTPAAVLAGTRQASVRKSDAQVNLIAANIEKITDDTQRKAYATLDSLYDSLLKTWNTAGTLSQEQVDKLNNVMMARARSLRIEDGNYPLFVAGKTRQMLEDERRDVDRDAIIAIRKDTLRKNDAWRTLVTKMRNEFAKKTSGKVPAPINVSIGQGKAYVAILTAQLKSDPNNKELQNKLEAAEAGVQAYLDWKEQIEKQNYTVEETGFRDKNGDEVAAVYPPGFSPVGEIGGGNPMPPPPSNPNPKPNPKGGGGKPVQTVNPNTSSSSKSKSAVEASKNMAENLFPDPLSGLTGKPKTSGKPNVSSGTTASGFKFKAAGSK